MTAIPASPLLRRSVAPAPGDIAARHGIAGVQAVFARFPPAAK